MVLLWGRVGDRRNKAFNMKLTPNREALRLQLSLMPPSYAADVPYLTALRKKHIEDAKRFPAGTRGRKMALERARELTKFIAELKPDTTR